MNIIRDSFVLPNGLSAARHENAIFNVPGLFLFSELIYEYIKIVNDKTGYNLQIKYLYGSPQLRWNNGRLILNSYNNDYSLYGIEKELECAVQNHITPLLTFSNLFIDSCDLKDEKCNDVLKIINDINGGVIVSSEMLRDYIMYNFPNISIHASVIQTTLVESRDESFYEELSNNYQCYCIHPDDNFDIELLKNIPNFNAEIIVNERCHYNCRIRKMHYEAISKEQISQSNSNYENLRFLDACNSIPESKQYKSNNRSISLSNGEMDRIIEFGFKLFKLQGRTDDLHVFFFDLMRYTLESEVVFPSIFPVFNYYIERFLKG